MCLRRGMFVSHVHMENVCTIQLSAELPSSSFEVKSPPKPHYPNISPVESEGTVPAGWFEAK